MFHGCKVAIALVALVGASLPTPVGSGLLATRGSTAGKLGQAASCKPRVPMAVEIESVAGAVDRWQLRFRSLDVDREVVVWIGAGAEVLEVWRGTLQAGLELQRQVTFGVPIDAVWAAVETRFPDDNGMRVEARPERSGTGHALASAEAGRLLPDPATGQIVIEYTGNVEDGR